MGEGNEVAKNGSGSEIEKVLRWMIGPDKRLGDNTLYDKTYDWLRENVGQLDKANLTQLLTSTDFQRLLWQGLTSAQPRVSGVFVRLVGYLAPLHNHCCVSVFTEPQPDVFSGGWQIVDFTGYSETESVHHHHHQHGHSHSHISRNQNTNETQTQTPTPSTSFLDFVLNEVFSVENVRVVVALESVALSLSNPNKKHNAIGVDTGGEGALWVWVVKNSESLLGGCLDAATNGSMYARQASTDLLARLVSGSYAHSPTLYGTLSDCNWLFGAVRDRFRKSESGSDQSDVGERVTLWVHHLILSVAREGTPGARQWLAAAKPLWDCVHGALMDMHQNTSHLSIEVLQTSLRLTPPLPWAQVLPAPNIQNIQSCGSGHSAVANQNADSAALVFLLAETAGTCLQNGRLVSGLGQAVSLSRAFLSSLDQSHSGFKSASIFLDWLVTCAFPEATTPNHANTHQTEVSILCSATNDEDISIVIPGFDAVQARNRIHNSSEKERWGLVQTVLEVVTVLPAYNFAQNAPQTGRISTKGCVFAMREILKRATKNGDLTGGSACVFTEELHVPVSVLKTGLNAIKTVVSAGGVGGGVEEHDAGARRDELAASFFPGLVGVLQHSSTMGKVAVHAANQALVSCLASAHCRALLCSVEGTPSQGANDLVLALQHLLVDAHWENRDTAMSTVSQLYAIAKMEMAACGRTEAGSPATPLSNLLQSSALLSSVWSHFKETEGYLRERVVECLKSATIGFSPPFRQSQLGCIKDGGAVGVVAGLAGCLVTDGEGLVRSAVLNLLNDWWDTPDMAAVLIGCCKDPTTTTENRCGDDDGMNGNRVEGMETSGTNIGGEGEEMEEEGGVEGNERDVERILDDIVGFENESEYMGSETGSVVSGGSMGSMGRGSVGGGVGGGGIKGKRAHPPLYISFMGQWALHGGSSVGGDMNGDRGVDMEVDVGGRIEANQEVGLVQAVAKATTDLNWNVRKECARFLARLFLIGQRGDDEMTNQDLRLDASQSAIAANSFYWMDGDVFFRGFASCDRPVRLEMCKWLGEMRQAVVSGQNAEGERAMAFSDWLKHGSVIEVMCALEAESQWEAEHSNPLKVFGLAEGSVATNIPDCYN